MTELHTSETLHQRVRAFARASLEPAKLGLRAKPEEPAELGLRAEPVIQPHDSFEALALDIARFQLEARRARTGVVLALPERIDDVLPVVVDAFRCSDVFTFPTELARVCFRTSGTTGANSGRHWMRTTETYETLALEWGRRALLPSSPSRAVRVVCLMPEPGESPSSSLGFMAQSFSSHFDAERHDTGSWQSERWCLNSDGLDLLRLRRQIEAAHELGQSVLLLATSFALVMLLDRLGEGELLLPPGSVVMQTGGFKGRTREVPADELAAALTRVLRPHAIVGEYGMTELSSQLYEGVLPGAALRGPPGIYLPPPWLRVVPLDPESLEPVASGEVGLGAFVDLANVDSALIVLTQDLVRLEAGGVRLLGRRPRAPLRGCSLAVEALGSSPLQAEVAPRVLPASLALHTPQPLTAARARIERLLVAARRLRDPNDPLGVALRRELVHSTGLSREAVELGLEHSLEIAPTDDELDALCRSLPSAPRIWVLLSGNVFVAAHRAIACALAASARVIVRPSRRDPVLANALHAATGDLFELSSELDPTSGDHVHAYGSDQTLDELAAKLPEGVVLLAHGSGLGAGLVLDPAQIPMAAEGFALDAVLFEQRGCLSPRVIGLGPGCDAAPFVESLLRALETWAVRVPPPLAVEERVNEERAELAWYGRLAPAIGDWRRVNTATADASGGSVLLLHEPHSLPVPPSGRHLVVFTSADPVARLRELEPLLTCIGVAGTEAQHSRIRTAFPAARVCAPGAMQCPIFDGPVDRRPYIIAGE